MTFALHSELILGAMWQEKMAVYLISWQFTDGFHITKATIHPIPPSPRVHTPIITVLNRAASNYSLSSFSILLIYAIQELYQDARKDPEVMNCKPLKLH